MEMALRSLPAYFLPIKTGVKKDDSLVYCMLKVEWWGLPAFPAIPTLK